MCMEAYGEDGEVHDPGSISVLGFGGWKVG